MPEDRTIKLILSILIALVCISIISYFGIKINKELTSKPIPTNKEQQIECLKMGSDFARNKCLQLIR